MKHPAGAPYFIGAFALAGSSVVAARLVGARLGPFTAVAASLLLTLPPLFLACRRGLPAYVRGLSARGWLLLFLQAFVGIFLFRMFLLNGLKMTSAGEAGLLTGATPAATALMAAIFLRESLQRARVLGIVCTVAGILLLQGLLVGGGLSEAHLAGNTLALLAALSESAYNILSRAGFSHAKDNHPQNPIAQTTVVVSMAFLLCLAPACLENPLPALVALDATGWLGLAWYGPVVTAVAFILWYSGIRRSEASVAAAFSGMMPLTALALSVLLLGERPGWQQLAGGALVVAGMLLSGLNSSSTLKLPRNRKKSYHNTQLTQIDKTQ